MFTNKNKKDDLAVLEREAQQNFSSYEGDESYDDDGYDDDGYDDDDSYDEDYSGGGKKLSVSERTHNIVVANTTAGDKAINLFDAYANSNANLNGLPAGATVTVDNGSYARFLNEISVNPILIVGIRMKVTNAIQFDQTITFVRTESNGKSERDPMNPNTWLNANQFNPNIAEIQGIRFVLDGKLALQFTLKEGVTATFIFFVTTKIDMGLSVEGKSVVRNKGTKNRRR